MFSVPRPIDALTWQSLYVNLCGVCMHAVQLIVSVCSSWDVLWRSVDIVLIPVQPTHLPVSCSVCRVSLCGITVTDLRVRTHATVHVLWKYVADRATASERSEQPVPARHKL